MDITNLKGTLYAVLHVPSEQIIAWCATEAVAVEQAAKMAVSTKTDGYVPVRMEVVGERKG